MSDVGDTTRPDAPADQSLWSDSSSRAAQDSEVRRLAWCVLGAAVASVAIVAWVAALCRQLADAASAGGDGSLPPVFDVLVFLAVALALVAVVQLRRGKTQAGGWWAIGAGLAGAALACMTFAFGQWGAEFLLRFGVAELRTSEPVNRVLARIIVASGLLVLPAAVSLVLGVVAVRRTRRHGSVSSHGSAGGTAA